MNGPAMTFGFVAANDIAARTGNLPKSNLGAQQRQVA